MNEYAKHSLEVVRYMKKEKVTPTLRVIPLGGVDEIGKNMTVLEFGDDIIIVDCGLAFPNEEMLGIDLVIPDFSYLERNRDKIRGIILTHGHEDHIGAMPYFLRSFNVPVYGSRLTLGLLEVKLAEMNVQADSLEAVEPRDVCKLGCFTVEFLKITHSIQGSFALAIHTPVGVVFHTGDFKVDYTPVDGQVIDFARIAALGEEGVLLLMADSTNVERPGYTLSERTVGANLEEYFRDAKGRIIITTFSSNVHRIQQIIEIAVRHNRKVCFSGRSMVRVANVAMELGELQLDPKHVVDVSETKNYPDKKLVVITTGSQGEPMSGLMRMANQMHPQFNIREGDTVILSATPVPGNEKFVYRLVDQLYRCGANVIYSALAAVHVSGHACQEELKLMHSLVRPKFFIPVHGDHRHLEQHANLAQQLGMKPKNTKIPKNGQVVEFTANSMAEGELVQAGGVLVDGLGIGDVGAVVLRDRRHLSQDGLMVVVMTLSREDGGLVAGPDVISRGFVYVRESDDLLEEARAITRDIIESHNVMQQNGDWSGLKAQVRSALNKYLYEKTKRNPMILPVVVEV